MGLLEKNRAALGPPDRCLKSKLNLSVSAALGIGAEIKGIDIATHGDIDRSHPVEAIRMPSDGSAVIDLGSLVVSVVSVPGRLVVDAVPRGP